MTTSDYISIFLKDAVRTVEINSTNNQSMEQSNADFTTCRNSADGVSLNNNNYSWCYYSNDTSQYTIARQYLKFDLSGVVGTIISAKIFVPDYASGRYVAVVEGTNTGTITTADFGSFTVDLLASGFDDAFAYGTGTLATFNPTGLYVLNLKTTKAMVVREYNYDYGNVAPSPGGLSNRTSNQVAKLILTVTN